MIKFTKEHEWIKIQDNIGIVGITSHATSQLGNVVFIELPQIGAHIKQGREIAVVESVKAASEIYAPLTGEVVETNQDLVDNPALVDQSPEGEGWFFKLRITSPEELGTLMSQEAYDLYVKG